MEDYECDLSEDSAGRRDWGVPGTSKETLDEYWEKLMEKADHNDKEEIKYFFHCTTKKGKNGITTKGRLIGDMTDLPARAPLASWDGMRGTWLEMSSPELPRRSPYGSQRMVFRVQDIMQYMEMNDEAETSDSDDTWDAEEDEQASANSRGGMQKKRKERKKKHRPVNKRQKDCYLKHEVPEKPHQTMSLLFFESAHYYSTKQYVRLLLVRQTDARVQWCREMCKELNIQDNPFFLFLDGRLYTYRSAVSRKKSSRIFIEVLVVGDIVFEKLPKPPVWDKVGTVPRAGSDPRIGIC